MLDSVRVRLTLWYSAVMTCVLVAIALATYAAIRQNAVRRTDASLSELAESFLATLQSELRDEPGPNAIQNAAEAAISEHSFRDVNFFVLDEHRQVVIASRALEPAASGPDEVNEFLNKVNRTQAQGAEPFHNVRVGGQLYRGYARPFVLDGKESTLVVLQSLRQQQEFLGQVGAAFALIIPLVIVLTSAGGYFLARRSLAPVVAMSSQAERIGEANIHERLPVKNDRDELGLLAQSFNGLLDRLDQSFERQRQFIADASHELRTPVAVLCGESEVALSQANRPAEEYRESLAILQTEAQRLRHIVEDLFTLARADGGQYPLTLTQFYLDELAADCCHTMRTLAQSKHIALHCEALPEMPVHADEALLRRMILNLLDNAIKHTPQGGAVSFGGEVTGSQCTLSVSDTGSGIAPELQSRIFERFFRADKVRSRSEGDGGGAGLGLAISRWIAEAHQGRLELSHSGTMGSTFTFFLPVQRT
jgi:two-component system, OmpR family, sensor kinase